MVLILSFWKHKWRWTIHLFLNVHLVVYDTGTLIIASKIQYTTAVVRMARSFLLFWTWWRHRMETFPALLALCAGNSPATGELLAQRPVRRSFGVFFNLRPNKRLSKKSIDRWFDTPSRSLWRHCIKIIDFTNILQGNLTGSGSLVLLFRC